MNIYIASCVRDGGIWRYEKAGQSFVKKELTPMDRPMYMVIEKQKMYIVLRDPFGNGNSGVVTYDIATDGRLCNPSPIQSTMGQVGCHIAVKDGQVYCANYISGSVIRLPDTLVTHEGHGPNKKRQDRAHTHFVGFTPDEKYLCVADLGTDTIYVYNLDMTLHTTVQVPLGHGVRHLAFSNDGKWAFAVNELASTVAAFAYDDGKMELVDICSCLPAGFAGESTAGAIRIRDGIIYVSNRGHDSVAMLRFESQHLSLVGHVPCGGRTPRDIFFVEEDLFCANQDSNNVAVLDSANQFCKIAEFSVETPLCIVCYQ